MSHSALNIALPDCYKCPSITETEDRLLLPPASSPLAHNWHKREGTSGSSKDTSSPLPGLMGWPTLVPIRLQGPWKWGIGCYVDNSEIRVETGHLSRITSSWLLPPSLFFLFFLNSLSVTTYHKPGPVPNARDAMPSQVQAAVCGKIQHVDSLRCCRRGREFSRRTRDRGN